MIINAAYMICDKNQEFKLKTFAEECFRLCYYDNKQNDIKVRLNCNKRQYIAKFNKGNYHLQKISC